MRAINSDDDAVMFISKLRTRKDGLAEILSARISRLFEEPTYLTFA
jgi:hypothetical protein